MSKIILQGGRLIDPETGLDETGDLVIEDGRVLALATAAEGGAAEFLAEENAEILDVTGLLVTPGLIDMHAHLREPGDEEEETIWSGSRAAVAGGITTVAAFPNTEPAVDNEASAEFVVLQGRRAGYANIFPVGTVTLRREGEELSEMAGLTKAGAVAFSDADRCLRSAEMMRRGLLYAKMFDRPVVAFCEDSDLRRGGVMNYGKVALRHGLPGIPAVSESIIVARDIGIADITQGRLHIGQLSAAGSVALVRQGKESGVKVTAEVTPHHFTLTDECCEYFDPNYKVLPPLRSQTDVDALLEGLRDGTIDVIVSAHAPHTAEEKAVEFVYAPFGVVGLETLFCASYTTLVGKHGFGVADVLAKLTINPARLLGLADDRGGISAGKIADVAVFDVETDRIIDPETFESKGRNTCFGGLTMRGNTVHTFVGGRQVVSEGRVLEPGQESVVER
ncbi:MAG: dihydroorotase [Planctomycetota bacterium]|nr:dihydroorotase [Planctomycetota bacterium]